MAASPAPSRVSSVVNGGLTWTDIADPAQEDLAPLTSRHDFHPLDVDEALSTRQLTKVEVHGGHMFICLLIPAQDTHGIIISRRVSMFVGKDYVVTTHPSELDAIPQILRQCREDQKAREQFMRSPAFLAYYLIDRLLDGIFTILDNVQASLDKIEKVVFNERKSTAKVINATRRQIAVLRRMVYPLQLYLPDLAQAQKFSGDDLSIYFNDSRHKIGKVSRMLDGMKEMVEIYNDTDFVTSSNRTNAILALLTIIFTLTLPTTIITGLFGMNVPLPGGLVPGPAEFFGTFTSLIIIVSVTLVATIVMVVYFKRAGWF